jgi:flagellar FliL protein
MTAIAQSSDTDLAAARPKRGIGGILRILGLVLGAAAFAGGGFGAGWYMFSNAPSPVADALRLIDRNEASDTAAPAQEPGMPRQPRPLPETNAFVTTYFTFPDPVTTNPAGSRRFVQLGISLSTQYDPKVMTHVETHKVALQSDMLAVIGGFTEEQMATREGRDALAMALRDAINARLESLEGFGGIEGVFFPSFVVQ